MSSIPAALACLLLAGVSTRTLAQPAITRPAITQAAPAPKVAASTVTAPPIALRQRTLKNGLKVFAVLDKTTPNVTVQVFYDVGGKDDPQGRSGFAHLFEHMMFKATRDMAAESLDRLTEDVGGFNNASTAEDVTNYYEVVPANHLQRLLWAEAERMSSLVVDQASFTSERAVVEEELRMRVLSDPYGRMWSYLLPDAAYAVHPYKRPVIGSIEDLDAATLGDVRAFHATYYRPDNANLIVVGNFDPAKLDAWIDAYFGGVQRPAGPIPRVSAVEPARTATRIVTGYGPNVPLPAVAMSWLIPPGSSHDGAALALLDGVLTTGRASRLYSGLVYQQQLAQSAFSQPDIRQQPGLFLAGLIMAGGRSVDDGLSALRAEVRRLSDAPVSEAELARAKNQLIAQTLRERETVDGRASEIGHAVIIEGDANRVNSDITEIQAATPADLQRVARLYLRDDNWTAVRYLPESARPASETRAAATPSPSKPSPVVAAVAPTVDVAPPPPAGLPRVVPAPGAALPVVPPRPAARTLPNGLRVVVARTQGVPLITAELAVRAGATCDPPSLEGLQSLTTALLTQGTTTRSAPEIAATVEALGGVLNTRTLSDGSFLTLTVLADQIEPALTVLSDVARHPAFAPAELERLRKQRLDELALAMGDPDALSQMAVWPAVFGGAPYGHPAGGTAKSLPKIVRADVAAQYTAHVRPDNAVLVLTGDLTPEQGFALTEQAFGDWRAPSTPLPAPPSTRAATGAATGAAAPPRVVVVDLPGTGQSTVTLAGPSIARADPRYFPVEVANAVLGGGYSARLNEEIRVKRGLTYGASSDVAERRDTGLFTASAQTKNVSAPEVADLLVQQVKNLAAAPIPATELDARKASLVGGYGRASATTAGLANQLAGDAIYGVPPETTARYTAELQAVSGAGVLAAAPAVVDPARATLLIVGDSTLFIDKLRAERLGVQVIPAAQLDLASPTLR